jgi:hypothetical protein
MIFGPLWPGSRAGEPAIGVGSRPLAAGLNAACHGPDSSRAKPDSEVTVTVAHVIVSVPVRHGVVKGRD